MAAVRKVATDGHNWTLYASGRDLFLEARWGRSAGEGLILVALERNEVRAYEKRGAAALDEVHGAIKGGATDGSWRHRDLYRRFGSGSHEQAIEAWRGD